MHKEILSPEQGDLLPFIKIFSNQFGLVGGTAIALWLGHRQSIDFDLFSEKEFDNIRIRQKLLRYAKSNPNIKIGQALTNKTGEYTLAINNVKVTFYNYPYPIDYSDQLDNIIKLPNLLTLAAMKAFALGHRSAWKDYVDLYFILKSKHGIKEVIEKGKEIFNLEFNDKLFRSQLAYFGDINFEKVNIDYIKGHEIEVDEIQEGLKEFSLEGAL